MEMKLRYAFTGAALILGVLASGQVVLLKDEDGNTVNGTVICHAAVGGATDTISLLTTLTGNTNKTINVLRYELQVPSGTKNFYCWGVCYTPQNAGVIPVWESVHPVAMVAGVEINNFHGYYQHEGYPGPATFRYVWFDVNNPQDTTWVDLVFGCSVGMNEGAVEGSGLEAFPNPAVDEVMTLHYTLDGAARAAELVVYNALGERIRREPIQTPNGTVVLQRDELRPGVYFATIEVDGRSVTTRRIVVGSR